MGRRRDQMGRRRDQMGGGGGDQMGGDISSLEHLIVHVHTFPKVLIHMKGKHIESTECAKNGVPQWT